MSVCDGLPGVKEALAYLRQEFVGVFYTKERTTMKKGVHPVALHKISVDDKRMLGVSYAPTLGGNTTVDVMVRCPHRLFPRRIARFHFATGNIWDDSAAEGCADTYDFTLLHPDKLKKLLKEYL